MYRKRIGAVQVSGFPLSSVVGMCIIVHSNAYREMNSLKKKTKKGLFVLLMEVLKVKIK